MILYLAGAEQEKPELLSRLTNSNLLFSYIYNPIKVVSIPHNVLGGLSFVDSGAFSAWTKGAKINTDMYIYWLNKNDNSIDLFGQLDAIPGDRNHFTSQKDVKKSGYESWSNYLYMRDRVVSPKKLLYTFHVGEPKEYLEMALEWKDSDGQPIPYIALGGLVGKPTEVRRNFLNMCFNIIRASPNSNVKVHTFGMTERKLLEEFPITSADSTSWIMIGATGGILTDVGIVYVTDKRKYEPNYYKKLFNTSLEKFNSWLFEFGFTVDELSNSRDNRIIYNGLWMMNRFSHIKFKGNNFKKALF